MDNKDSVLIVGAGPTGCALALLLARLGMRVMLVEQSAEPQGHPAACILSTRTMEIFREIGVDAPIQAVCQDMLERGNIPGLCRSRAANSALARRSRLISIC
jgi:2-polyprenyl-6-methoxyphenol hydroxylase-like FAD-dependent oxidoreductase